MIVVFQIKFIGYYTHCVLVVSEKVKLGSQASANKKRAHSLNTA